VSAIDDLRKTMARLRAPDGCPWDREQTHQTLCEPLIDETAELLDTIDRNDMEHMCEELGDVLLQVVFHAQLADERGDFNFDDVAKGINDKLVRRHPHVFGDVDLQDTEAVLHQWEAIKAAEKKNGPESNGKIKHLPPSLPAIMYAADVAKQIRKKDFGHEELPDPDGVAEIAGDLTEEEVGQMLYQIAAACDKAGIDGESALRKFASKLVREIEANG
jgi:XTP/dITP diphosphohydrolase/tetrapyrrole methylase family protein/MazG family protein